MDHLIGRVVLQERKDIRSCSLYQQEESCWHQTEIDERLLERHIQEYHIYYSLNRVFHKMAHTA